MALKLARATLPSRPLTQSSRTVPARCALRCSTRTNAMVISLRERSSRAPDRVALKTDPLAWTHLAPAHGRAGGGHGPFLHGKGLGMGGLHSSRSSEPVSRPTALKIPPQVPLARSTGACWGERGGTTGARAATPAGGAAKRSRPPCHEQRRPCGRRATKRSDWRGGRAAASTSMDSVSSGPASGVAGGRGDDLAGAKPTQRSVVGAAPVSSSSALVVHAQREGSKSARSPGTGTGRCRVDRRQSRPGRVRARDGRPKDRDAQRLDAQRNSPVRRSRMRPGALPRHCNQRQILLLPPGLPPQSGDAGLRVGPSTIGQMNRQGLYWPTGRNLFRRRSLTAGRVALWIVVAALVAAWVSGHIQ